MSTEQQPKRILLLNPNKEDERIWRAKREGQRTDQLQSAEVLLCHYCEGPIGPLQLIIDRKGERACTSCAQKIPAE